MKKTSKLVVISAIFMAIFSLTSPFKIEVGGEKIGLASITLIIGIVAFFVTRKTRTTPVEKVIDRQIRL